MDQPRYGRIAGVSPGSRTRRARYDEAHAPATSGEHLFRRDGLAYPLDRRADRRRIDSDRLLVLAFGKTRMADHDIHHADSLSNGKRAGVAFDTGFAASHRHFL